MYPSGVPPLFMYPSGVPPLFMYPSGVPPLFMYPSGVPPLFMYPSGVPPLFMYPSGVPPLFMYPSPLYVPEWCPSPLYVVSPPYIFECSYCISTIFLSPGFVLYALLTLSLSIYLIFVIAPQYGQSNILVYIAICSLIGSLSVMACKGLSIAIKLTLSGVSQLTNPLSWFFLLAVATCITIQMNYLNKALDIFNTSIVTPIYYVMFTTLTIIASAILFQEWKVLVNPVKDVVGALCGFGTIIFGVFLLHAFRDFTVTIKDLLSLTSRQNGHGGGGGGGGGGGRGGGGGGGGRGGGGGGRGGGGGGGEGRVRDDVPLESVLLHSAARQGRVSVSSAECSRTLSEEEEEAGETQPFVQNVS